MARQAFELEVQKVYNRVVKSQKDSVKAAIRAGSEVVSFGRYYVGGVAVLTVKVPDSWRHLEVYRNSDSISCEIDESEVQATQTWTSKKYPHAQIALG